MKKKTWALEDEAMEFIRRELETIQTPDYTVGISLARLAHLMAKFYEYRVRFEK
jgi:hypothetical protein